MIISIKKNANPTEVQALIKAIEAKGVKAVEIQGSEYNVFGLTGDTSIIDEKAIKAYRCVESVVRVQAKYKLANRMFHPEDTVIDVNGIRIGGNEKIVVIGGPCAVENKEMIINSYASEIGKTEERVSIDTDEKSNIDISFSAKYMMDALKTIKDEDILILLNNDVKPIVLKSLTDESLIQLILPIKTY